MFAKYTMKLACLACGLLVLGAAHAQTKYVDNFSGVKTQLPWTAFGTNGCCQTYSPSPTPTVPAAFAPACLTASGDDPDNPGTYGGIPQCSGTKLAYKHSNANITQQTLQTNDPAGFGALRLTPAIRYQTGAILSNFTFPTKQGVEITFTTYTYNGTNDGTASNGADGIVFMLTDGTAPMPTGIGAAGGPLGYTCSTTGIEGMANAYLGLGIDEYGNFLNAGSHATKDASAGILNTNNTRYTMGAALGTNTWKATGYNNDPAVQSNLQDSQGPQFQPMRIGLRGAGNLTWAWLKSKSTYYNDALPSATKTTYIQNACRSGTYIDSAGKSQPIPYNYKSIPGGYYVLNNSQLIASNSGQTRVNSTSGASNSAVFPITYKLRISPSGLLNFAFSYNNGAYQQVLANRQIAADNGPLPELLRFGFAASTGGSDNVHEITCFQVTPTISNSSAGGNTTSGRVQIGSQIYLASYNTNDNDWLGTVQAVPVVTDGTDLSLSPTPNWDANCVLTGGACASTNTGKGTTNADGSSYEPQPQPAGSPTNTAARVLLTFNPSTGKGVPFLFDSLDTAASTALGADATTRTAAVAWLRGDRSNEQLWGSTPGNLRARTGVLGDIINSSPTWVGPPQPGAYPNVFKDALYPAATAPESAYSAYAASAARRQAVVYAGSNDGFLHGFRTGAINAVADSSGNDGQEVLGFMPSGQLLKYAAGLTRPAFTHNYLVDATPGVGDLYYGGEWHTWLVGGVGSTGQEIYALDITDPSRFTENNAGALVIGDWTASATQLSKLNCTVGTPAIVRLHNGRWGIIFGNGLPDLNSTTTNCRQKTGTTYTAGIYIGLIDPDTGAVSFSNVGSSGTGGFLDTLNGTSATPNGIAEISAVDADGDGIVDYVYGGDLRGNVWRFDLTAATPSGWKVSTYGGTSAKPLFTAANSQPITAAPIVASVPSTGGARMMVYFGTGRLTPMSATSGATYATGQQAFYGIWDWDWPASLWKTSFVGLSPAPATVTTASLQQQTLTQNTATVRTLSANTVCWADKSACANSRKYGWYFNLPTTGEQIIYNPTVVEAAIVVDTAIPPVTSTQVCAQGKQQTGWTMAFDPETGGARFANGFFKIKDPTSNVVTVTDGVHLDAVGTPTVLRYHGRTWIAAQTVSGAPALVEVNKPTLDTGRRVSWRELRL